jgi:hypothetical protein
MTNIRKDFKVNFFFLRIN